MQFILGGNADIWLNTESRQEYSEFSKVWHAVIQLVIEENKQGRYFPLWGTCLGFQQIVLHFSGDPDFLENFDDKN